MENFSLIEKFKILINIFTSSPIFFGCIIVSLLLLIFFIYCIITNKKTNKWLFISIWAILLLILIIRYNFIVFSLIDNVFDNIFMALYFPNLTVYIAILFASNFFFVYSILNKKVKKSHKILNIINCLIIDIFLFIIMDTVSSNAINVYDEITVYTNSNLLVLLELNSGIFTSWVLLNLLISAHDKLKKYDEKEYPDMPEIIFDDEYVSP